MICRYKMPNFVFRSLLVFPDTRRYLTYAYICALVSYAPGLLGSRRSGTPKVIATLLSHQVITAPFRCNPTP